MEIEKIAHKTLKRTKENSRLMMRKQNATIKVVDQIVKTLRTRLFKAKQMNMKMSESLKVGSS